MTAASIGAGGGNAGSCGGMSEATAELIIEVTRWRQLVSVLSTHAQSLSGCPILACGAAELVAEATPLLIGPGGGDGVAAAAATASVIDAIKLLINVMAMPPPCRAASRALSRLVGACSGILSVEGLAATMEEAAAAVLSASTTTAARVSAATYGDALRALVSLACLLPASTAADMISGGLAPMLAWANSIASALLHGTAPLPSPLETATGNGGAAAAGGGAGGDPTATANGKSSRTWANG